MTGLPKKTTPSDCASDGACKTANCPLELQPSRDLDSPRRTYSTGPLPEIAATDVVVEGEARTLVVHVGCVEEVVIVKGVKELKTKLEV